MNEIFFFSTRILSLITLAVSVIFAIRYWNSSLKEIKILAIYLFLVLVNEIISESFIALGFTSNIFLFYIYSFFEIVLLSLTYKVVFNQFYIKWTGSIITIVALIIGGYIIYEGWIYIEKGINEVYGKSISNLWIILLGGFYLVNQLKSHSAKGKHHFDRINLIILFYFSVSLVVFSIMNQLQSLGKESTYVIWGINNIFCFLFYFVFLRSFKR